MKKTSEKEKTGSGVKIGLEIHVALTTNTKLFCGCSTKWQNKEPNSNCCPTCLGMPGSKPRLNEKAVEYASRIGLALNCSFSKEMHFSRKSYFYPDMSKNFQITQYEIPICKGGFLNEGKKKIRIRRIQIEEDPARLVHPEGSMEASRYVLIDYNRSGIPLCEIVTEPDFQTPKQARNFLQKISSILEYLDVYDSSLEGSMRVDANVSIMGGERVEIKNISGFRQVEKALSFEIIRQQNLAKRGRKVSQETRGFDAVSGTTILQRKKEFEEEYGYIFEPDLTMIEIKKQNLEKIRKVLPELPDSKLARYGKIIGSELAESIVTDPELAAIFEEAVKKYDPKTCAIWFGNVLKKILNYNNMRMKQTGIQKEHMIRFMKMIADKKVTDRMGEMILREMVKKPEKINELSGDFRKVDDNEEIKNFALVAMRKNPKAVADFRSGKREAFEFLVGQAMKESRGRADPSVLRTILIELIE